MNKFMEAVNDCILKLNKFSKIVFTYSIIISILTLISAVVLNILSRKYWDYYTNLIISSEIMLQIFQLSVGAIIIAILIDIVIKTKDK